MGDIKGTLSGISPLFGTLSGTSSLSGTLSGGFELVGTLSGISSLSGVLSGASTISGALSTPQSGRTSPFEGAYEYTPSNEVQTIEIADLRATQNITINAIPNNYGLVTWNGSTLTIS